MLYKVIVVDGKNNYEHRLIMEEHLGRKLTKDEYVHHIDQNKLNNSIDNLLITNSHEHIKLHKRPKKIEKEILCCVYTIKEFAKLIGKTTNTLDRWDKSGKFKARRLPSGGKFYNEEDLSTILHGQVEQ